MLKFNVLILFALTSFVVALPQLARKAAYCDPSKCKLPNCVCYGSSPGIKTEELPQLVILSSDDAIGTAAFDTYIKPALYGRKNPDNCSVGATFFVPHEYSNYAIVHDLWAKGFEIGVNSITKTALASYWKEVNESMLIDEFSGQKTIISKFAQIPKADIRGARVPLLELPGDKYFTALNKSDLNFDSSWPTARHIWPYTLDFHSEQDCPVGECPEQIHNGTWVSSLNMWKDINNVSCNTVLGCQVLPENETDILNWLKLNFNNVYNTDRTPFNIVMNVAVFTLHKNFFDAYLKFLDYLSSLKDVYFVNEWQAIQWMQNPKRKNETFPVGPCRKENTEPVSSRTCMLEKSETEIRYMTISTPEFTGKCPENYPWLGNPEGN